MKNQESSYKSRPFYLGISVILLVLLIGSVMVAVTMGSAQISVTDVYKVMEIHLEDDTLEEVTDVELLHELLPLFYNQLEE